MSKKSWLVGVDPGTNFKEPSKAGQICFLSEEWDELYFLPCFEKDEIRGALAALNENILWVVVEEIASKFGKPHGDFCRWLERLEMLRLRHCAVHPSLWQKSLGEHQKKGAKGSVDYIQARHPEFTDSIRNLKRGFNSNKADSLVLAMYAEKYIRPPTLKAVK